MKNKRLLLYHLLTVFTLAFASSCSGPKQVFYFRPDAATPKTTAKETISEPVFDASNTVTPTDLPHPALNATASAEIRDNALSTLSKKDLRKLLRKTLKDIRDTTDTKGRNRRVGVAANKDRLSQLEAEAREIKNSVRVQNNDNKVMVDVKKPSTNFSQTELILLGVAALLVLLLLLSIPFIGQLLGIVLALAVVALALAVLTGIIEINV